MSGNKIVTFFLKKKQEKQRRGFGACDVMGKLGPGWGVLCIYGWVEDCAGLLPVCISSRTTGTPSVDFCSR